MWLLLACRPSVESVSSSGPPPWTSPSTPIGTSPGPTTPPEPTTPTTPAPVPFEQRVMYLVMPDRFVDGDEANDGLGVPGCFDPGDPGKFHGGDWKGLADRLDYLAELG